MTSRNQTIGLIGGTGPEGKGLAVRFALAGHNIVIGSRDAGRASSAATAIGSIIDGRHGAGLAAGPTIGKITGDVNKAAARAGDIVILAVPYGGQAATLEELEPELDGKIVRYPFFGPGALLDDKVAFWVVFVGDSEGVFVVGETRQGDSDNDNDRDLRDVAGFMNCFNCNEMPIPPFECLQAFDVDGDGNIGGFDFQLAFHAFPNVLTGPQ